MDPKLLKQIQLLNPWLSDASLSPLPQDNYIPRIQTESLMNPEWDKLVMVLVGPRQAGKTTLGKYIAHQLIQQKRFNQLLYLSCDSPLIRHWLTGTHILHEVDEEFELKQFILFIDEIQRLENPGIFIKSLIDLQLPIKFMVSGSSQLEIRSKVQEFLTGRQFEATVLPLSFEEIKRPSLINNSLRFGCYPQIIQSHQQKNLLSFLYDTYINKDIIEILKVGMPAVMEKLMTLVGHSSGQLINISKFATDCQVSATTINSYLDILKKTYVIAMLPPFVGNKRVEVKSSKKCYYLDNGFRNQSLGNFTAIEDRQDRGFLIESAVFQEIYKHKMQHFLDFKIYYWRTKSGAEVDIILQLESDIQIPIEVKYQPMKKASISRSYRSFLEAYSPKTGVIVTLNFEDETMVEKTKVYFIPFHKLKKLFQLTA